MSERHMREKFRGHPRFERTEEFCRLFDQVALNFLRTGVHYLVLELGG